MHVPTPPPSLSPSPAPLPQLAADGPVTLLCFQVAGFSALAVRLTAQEAELCVLEAPTPARPVLN